MANSIDNYNFCIINNQSDCFKIFFGYYKVLFPNLKDTILLDQIYRNRNILEAHYYGRTGWQKRRDYGKRNYSELAIYRYKRILGDKLHARKFHRQRQEALIGCSILNKMMCMTLANTSQLS